MAGVWSAGASAAMEDQGPGKEYVSPEEEELEEEEEEETESSLYLVFEWLWLEALIEKRIDDSFR